MRNLLILSLLTAYFFINHTIEANSSKLQETEAQQLTPPIHDKKTVAIFPFTGQEKFSSRVALHGLVTEAVAESGRFSLVERAQIDAIIKEIEEQMGVDYRNTEYLAEQGVAMGAQYLLFGNINNIQITRKRNQNTLTKKYTTTYECDIQLNLKIVDTGTREVKATETLNIGGNTGKLFDLSFASGDTEIDAWNAACKKLVKKVKDFIKDAIPVNISIVQIEAEKKGKATELLIAGGSNIGLSKNDKIIIYELSEINVGGETLKREQEIAILSVSELQGKNLSVCKVKSNGDILKEKIIGGANLICKTQ